MDKKTNKINQFSLIGTTPFSFDNNLQRKLAEYGVKMGTGIEIGPFVEIHRGRSRNTVIGNNVKIAGHCMIGNSCIIGDNTIITTGVYIAARVEIGKDCYFGMGAVVRQGVKIGNNVTVGMGAVVIKDIPDGVTVVGNPARELKKESTE